MVIFSLFLLHSVLRHLFLCVCVSFFVIANYFARVYYLSLLPLLPLPHHACIPCHLDASSYIALVVAMFTHRERVDRSTVEEYCIKYYYEDRKDALLILLYDTPIIKYGTRIIKKALSSHRHVTRNCQVCFFLDILYMAVPVFYILPQVVQDNIL